MLTPTKTKPDASLEPAATQAAEGGPRAVKERRRPLAMFLSAAAVLIGALFTLWAWTATTSTTEVLAVRDVVLRGEVITRDDLVVVRAGGDPAVQTVAASEIDRVAGQRAALDLAAGGLLAPGHVATFVVPGQGSSVVGIGLSSGMLPAEPLNAGDEVRIVQTPGQQGDVTEAPVTVKAEIVGVHPSQTKDVTIVDVLVPSERAADLAARAATGKVALVLDSRER